MKRIMLSAASIMFIFTGAFARPTKAAASTTSSNAQMQQLSKEFPGLSSTIPSSVEITKHFQVTTESDEDIIPTGYEVILGGKHFDEKAYYNADGIMMSYKEELKNTELPDAVRNAIMQKHSDAVITKDKEFIKDTKGSTAKMYEVNFKDGKKHYKAIVESDGTIDHMHRQLI